MIEEKLSKIKVSYFQRTGINAAYLYAPMYVLDYNAEEPIMLLNKFIGGFVEGEGWGVSGADFQRELLELDGMGKKRIVVYINCPGGEVVDGMNIVNAILHSKTPVDTVNVGLCASMGMAVFMAGRKREMADYAKAMIHNPSGGDKEALKAFTDAYCKMVCSKCNLEEPEVLEMMAKETWMSAEECMDKGFCTSIIPTSETNKKYMAAPKAMWERFNKVAANSFNIKTPNNKMKKVTALLKLTEDASEDSMVEAINGIEAKVTETAAELQTSQQTVARLEQELAAEKTKAEGLEKKIKDEEEASAEAKATEMVTAFAKAGRIKNEPAVIAKWTGLAKADFEGTKKMIEELPLNKVSAKLPEVTTGTGKVTAAMKMIEIANKHNQK